MIKAKGNVDLLSTFTCYSYVYPVRVQIKEATWVYMVPSVLGFNYHIHPSSMVT